MQFIFPFRKTKLVQLIILAISIFKPNQTETSQENYRPTYPMNPMNKNAINKIQKQQLIKGIL